MEHTLDRSIFNKTIDILSLRIKAEDVQSILKSHREALWHMPKRRPVVACPDGDTKHKLVLFKNDIPEDLLSKGTQIFYQLHVSYEDFSFDEVMRRVIPSTLEPPSSFESIGHIAHFNLRDEVWPWRYVIGEVLLDKHPQYRTVVAKVGSLHGQFRTFDMDVLAGDKDLIAEVKEEGLTITVPFDKVYWNSRLSGERDRLVRCFNKQDTLIDMFAGVGALACLAARKGCDVYANDLNPAASQSIERNALRNKVIENVKVVENMDAREFLRSLVQNQPSLFFRKTNKVQETIGSPRRSPRNKPHQQQQDDSEESVIHFMMNLPEIAIEFLDVFKQLIHNNSSHQTLRPFMIHCHCFAKSKPADEEVIDRLEKVLEIPHGQLHLYAEDFKLVPVRDVSPNKIMYCVEFRPSELLLISQKRRKVSSE